MFINTRLAYTVEILTARINYTFDYVFNLKHTLSWKVADFNCRLQKCHVPYIVNTHLLVTYKPISAYVHKSLILNRAVQTLFWRAGVLQSLAPTCLNTPAWKFQVHLWAWLAASGVFNSGCS